VDLQFGFVLRNYTYLSFYKHLKALAKFSKIVKNEIYTLFFEREMQWN